MTKTAEKTVYTDEVVKELTAEFTAAPDYEARVEVMERWADKLGTSVPSVRMKLVSEKVYIPKERKTKDGRKPETKEQMVTRLEEKLGLEPGDLDSVEKATKRALRFLLGE